MDAGIWGTIFFIVICAVVIGIVGFFVLWMLWRFWRVQGPNIWHRLIKSNSDPASAVILETKKGSQFDVGSDTQRGYSGNLAMYQTVRVKLEVHPNNGAPYIAYDQFNAEFSPAKNDLQTPLTPGAKLQVAVSRFNPQWVVALLETMPPPYEQKK
jgi:hypothetical protein